MYQQSNGYFSCWVPWSWCSLGCESDRRKTWTRNTWNLTVHFWWVESWTMHGIIYLNCVLITCIFIHCSFSSNILAIYTICESKVWLRCFDLHSHLYLSFGFWLSRGWIVWFRSPKIIYNCYWSLLVHSHKPAFLSRLGWHWASQFDS